MCGATCTCVELPAPILRLERCQTNKTANKQTNKQASKQASSHKKNQTTNPCVHFGASSLKPPFKTPRKKKKGKTGTPTHRALPCQARRGRRSFSRGARSGASRSGAPTSHESCGRPPTRGGARVVASRRLSSYAKRVGSKGGSGGFGFR